MSEPPIPYASQEGRTMTDAQRLAYLEKLVERWVIGELSTEDYHVAVREIFAVPKKPLDNSSDIN